MYDTHKHSDRVGIELPSVWGLLRLSPMTVLTDGIMQRHPTDKQSKVRIKSLVSESPTIRIHPYLIYGNRDFNTEYGNKPSIRTSLLVYSRVMTEE